MKAVRSDGEVHHCGDHLTSLLTSQGMFFFLFEKKDKTLHILIDYRGMNSTMVTNKYPLRLIYPVLETLQEAQILTKLGLHNLG